MAKDVNPAPAKTKTPEEFQKELRTRFYGALAAGIVAAVVGSAAAVWGYIKTVPGAIGLVPQGAVVAFERDCPLGWERYWPATSRAIIGAAEQGEMGNIPSQFARADGDKQLTARAVLSVVGEEFHTMTLAELVSHSHSYNSEIGTDGNRSGVQDATFNGTTEQTSAVGGSEPFNVMQPSIALYYCRKSS